VGNLTKLLIDELLLLYFGENTMRCQHEMIEAARSYCELIEGLDGMDAAWLDRVARLLPRLHVAIAEMGDQPKGSGLPVVKCDLDDRFELYTRLHTLLGDKDPYWMEFDMAMDGQAMSGSLADDLTDIFCELKRGLEMLDGCPNEPSRALDTLCSGFQAHWGQHLLDAQRHLYSLGACNQLRC
jgi:hypothetical protein